ncbi:MAG: hypothetical protein II767_11970 [Proteobacteria bacterium]|nr:hypothetical protein [Pseudomonadota bacterium]
MKKNLILMSILAAALLSGCNDNDKKDTIADGTLSCSVKADGGEIVIVYDNGSWKQKEECKGSCHDGSCLSTREACSDSKIDCISDVLDADGKKSILRACSDGEYRYTNCALLDNKICSASGSSASCVDDPDNADRVCVDGTYRCNLSGSREYCSSGKWTASACSADTVCSAGECVAKPHVCNEGQKVCDGIVSRTCVNNAWVDQTCNEASQACVSGECVPLPKMWDACGDFKSTCSNGNLYKCVLTQNSAGKIGYFVLKAECEVDATESWEEGLACVNFSTGSDCVYKNDAPYLRDHGGACEYEGQVIFHDCTYDEDYREYFLSAAKCVEKDGEIYAAIINPDKVCDGNDRVSCNPKTGDIIRESCTSCHFSAAYEEAQCVNENGGNNNGGNGGNGGGNSSDSCDYWNCGPEDEEILDDCKADGYDSALCFYESDGLYYTCMNREASKDSSCSAGEVAYSQNGKVECLVVGDDEACLEGGSDFRICNELYGDYCSAHLPGSAAVCFGSDAMCVPTCSKEGEKGYLCTDDPTDPNTIGRKDSAVCTNIDGTLIYWTDGKEVSACPGRCAADHLSCADE